MSISKDDHIQFTFENITDAEKILFQINDILDMYGVISVLDVYSIIDKSEISCLGLPWDQLVPKEPLGDGEKYGWTKTAKMEIKDLRPIQHAVMLILSKPELLFDDIGNGDIDLKKNDPVSHPSHYQSKNGLEVIDVINAFTDDLEGMEAVCTANILKYVCRWKKKNGAEDLKKAIWYAEYLVNYIQQSEKENKEETNNE